MQPGLYYLVWVSLRVKLGVVLQCERSGESLWHCRPDASPVPLHRTSLHHVQGLKVAHINKHAVSQTYIMIWRRTIFLTIPHTQAHSKLSKISAWAKCTRLLLFSLIIKFVLTLRRHRWLPGSFKTTTHSAEAWGNFSAAIFTTYVPVPYGILLAFEFLEWLPNVKHRILEYKWFYLCLPFIQQRPRDSKPAWYQVLFSF